MNEQEQQALAQMLAWVNRLELNGQALNDKNYFARGNDIWKAFEAVGLLHGLTAQQVIDLGKKINLVEKSG